MKILPKKIIDIGDNCPQYKDLITNVLFILQTGDYLPLTYKPRDCRFGENCYRQNPFHRRVRHGNTHWSKPIIVEIYKNRSRSRSRNRSRSRSRGGTKKTKRF